MKDETYRKMSQKRKNMQDKIKKALIKNEFLLNEKITSILEHQKRLEDIKEQKEKEKEFELLKQSIENKRRTLKRKSILLKNEELIKEKIQKYNHKQEILKKRQDQRHIKELETAVEENRKKEFRDKKLRESDKCENKKEEEIIVGDVNQNSSNIEEMKSNEKSYIFSPNMKRQIQ